MSKDETIRLVIYIISGGLVIMAWGIALGFIKSDVKHIDEKATENCERIADIEKEASAIGADVREIRVEQKYIKKGIDEIKESLNGK